jgi:hypothetical protein
MKSWEEERSVSGSIAPMQLSVIYLSLSLASKSSSTFFGEVSFSEIFPFGSLPLSVHSLRPKHFSF